MARVDKARLLLLAARDAVDAKKVADMARAAEVYAKRQKLSEDAIRYATAVKVDAMTLMGKFLETMPKAKGGKPYQKCATLGKKPRVPTLIEHGIEYEEAKACRRLVKLASEQPEKYVAIREAKLPISAATSSAHVSHNAGDNEWYTPKEYIEAAVRVIGSINIDPASSKEANKVIGADRFFGKNEDGLQQEWPGNVWMNPPYSQPLCTQFCEYLVRQHKAGITKEAIVLVNNATETEWFQNMARYAGALCFPKGRIKFWCPEKTSAPLQGQALLYLFGHNARKFCDEFAKFGLVFRT